jgi:hypothetical protein
VTKVQDSERALLQRRIKNQRAELRRLNRTIITQNQRIQYWMLAVSQKRTETYRHAAKIAEGPESFWLGRRIAAAIRRWL